MTLADQDTEQKLTLFTYFKQRRDIARSNGEASITMWDFKNNNYLIAIFPKFMWNAVDKLICTIYDPESLQPGMAISEQNYFVKQELGRLILIATSIEEVNAIDVSSGRILGTMPVNGLAEQTPLNMDDLCEEMYQDVNTIQEEKDWLFARRLPILDENEQPTGKYKYNLFNQ